MTDRVAAATPPAIGDGVPAAGAAGNAGTSPPEPSPGAPTVPEPLNRLRHCWVVDGHGRLPALLLGWRRTDAGFQGRVVRPVHQPEMGWIVVEEWLPAGLLEPA